MPTYSRIFKDRLAVKIAGPSFRGVRPLLFLLLLLTSGFGSCRHHDSSHNLSFYYWRTHFHLSHDERTALSDNGVKILYTRYFDMDFAPEDTAPRPLAPLVFEDTPLVLGDPPSAMRPLSDSLQIIPVIFIRNRVFEKIDTAGVYRLADNMAALVAAISASGNIKSSSIQFDCDWTERTKDRYFLFIRVWRRLFKQSVSATIRLHQVKYPEKTGIPPVDKGVLMYYNMGNISAGSQRSLYDKSIADRYIPSLKTYPLNLDIALPIFSWGLLVRQGKVTQLLEKMNFRFFENDSNFSPLKKDRYHVNHSCFKGGYYFRENDEVKIETVEPKELLDIVSQINRYSNHRIGDFIFYDLDDSNLLRYDKNSFKKIRDLAD